jgi:predicted homoserine dehydrogenase-like protein
MSLLEQALRQRATDGKPIRIAVVGAGTMGRALANQIVNFVPGLRLVAIANRRVDRAIESWRQAGIGQVIEVESVARLDDAIGRGHPAVTADAGLLCESGAVDILLEATGAVEFAAGLALRAFACGKNLVTLTAELDGTVGPILQQHAARAGVVFSVADGDQPGVEMNLWRHVRAMGLEPLVCGNIKGLQDPYRNPTTQRHFAETWGQSPLLVTSAADGSKVAFEQACVANATGMTVERLGMLGGEFHGHLDEMCHSGRYDVDRLRELGGVVDYVVGAMPLPAIFVFATVEDPKQRRLLELYKLGKGPLYSFYTPYHLCHLEAPLSAARVALFGDPTLAALRPMVDVVTTAKTDLRAGDLLDAIGGYTHYGQCETYPLSRAGDLLPQGLAEGCRLLCDVPMDALIRRADVSVPAGRVADGLREEQDRAFPAV